MYNAVAHNQGLFYHILALCDVVEVRVFRVKQKRFYRLFRQSEAIVQHFLIECHLPGVFRFESIVKLVALATLELDNLCVVASQQVHTPLNAQSLTDKRGFQLNIVFLYVFRDDFLDVPVLFPAFGKKLLVDSLQCAVFQGIVLEVLLHRCQERFIAIYGIVKKLVGSITQLYGKRIFPRHELSHQIMIRRDTTGLDALANGSDIDEIVGRKDDIERMEYALDVGLDIQKIQCGLRIELRSQLPSIVVGNGKGLSTGIIGFVADNARFVPFLNHQSDVHIVSVGLMLGRRT